MGLDTNLSSKRKMPCFCKVKEVTTILLLWIATMRVLEL
jgi:hypothetical protein